MWNFSDAYPNISGKEFEETYIRPVQKELKGLETERSNLAYDYKAHDDSYDEYHNLQGQMDSDRTLINATAFDEALHYMDLENLQSLLRK